MNESQTWLYPVTYNAEMNHMHSPLEYGISSNDDSFLNTYVN